MSPLRILLLPLGAALAAAVPTRATEPAPFHAFLAPPVTVTQVDSVVAVTFEVDSTAMRFNAFEVTVRFDSTVVEYVDVTKGALMTSTCSNGFTNSVVTGDTVTFTYALLCAGATVYGPGVLCTFRFRALADGVTALEIVSPDSCTFADAGACVSPADSTFPRLVTMDDAFIAVGSDPTAAAPAATPPALPEVRVTPNPVRGTAMLRARPARPGPARIEIFDAAGRRVFARAWESAGDEVGVPWAARGAPAGVYFVRLRSGGTSAMTRLILVR